METMLQQLDSLMPHGLTGSVVRTEGVAVSVAGFPAPVGALVEIDRQAGSALLAEVIGFQGQETLLYPFQEVAGVRHGNRVRLVRTAQFLPVGEQLLGRIVDAHASPIDGLPQPTLNQRVELNRQPPPAVERPRIHQAISTGVRAVDGLLTCGLGQRLSTLR